MIFLIEYDRREGNAVSKRVFLDWERSAAADARFALELELERRGLDHEVVLLDAKDEDALRRTHARYFENLGDIILRLESSTGEMVRDPDRN